MPIPDAEMARQCQEVFGDPLDSKMRANLGKILETLNQVNLQVINDLSPDSEPMTHRNLLKGSTHE